MTINALDISMRVGAGGVLEHIPVSGPLVGLADPTLATNATGIADWSPAYPFINIMKQARAWTAPGYGNWDTLSAGGYIHTDGYANAIPPAASAVEAVFDWANSQGTYYGGERFVVTWEGTGTLNLGGAVSVVSSTANSITFDFNANPSTLTVRILTTAAVPNHIKNITIIADKFQSLYDSGERLNPDYVEFVQDFRVFRFMDWMQTNWSKVVDWADYTTEDYPTYANEGNDSGLGNRAPMSMIVAMANKIQADPWVCIPHQASDAFVTTFAEYMRDNLDSNLVCHFELSNEIWNFNFPHWEYFRDIGLADWPGAAGEGDMNIALNAYAKRAVQCFALIDIAYAGQLGRRKNVLGSSNDDVTDQSVAAAIAPLWQTYDPTGYIRPSTVAQALAIAPYYGTAMWGTDSAGLIAATAAGTHLEWMYNWLTDPVNESSIPSMISNMQLQKGVAAAEGLELIQYEGLRHYLHSGTATGAELDSMLEFSRSIYDADLAIQAWEAWELIGDGPLMVFADLTTPGESGVWGMVEYFGHTSPYSEALAGLNYWTPNWWGGTRDYRNQAITGATSYYPDVGLSKPVSGLPTTEINAVTGYVMGHSLWQHGTFDYQTGEWISRFAAHAGKTASFTGRFGQLADHVTALPIDDHNAVDQAFGYPSGIPVDSWTAGNTWNSVAWDHLITMPWNFAQNDSSSTNTPDPFTNVISIVDFWIANKPNAKMMILEHWPETGMQPGGASGASLSDANWRAYWEYTRLDSAFPSDYHGWFLRFQDSIHAARPAADIKMIPVGPILADLFLDEPYMNAVPSTDYFEDNAPHGLPALYFLASLIYYRQIYGVSVDSGYTIPTTSPADIPAVIRNNFATILTFIDSRLDFYNVNGVRVY